MSLPHPCNNLPVSLRGVSYGRYHKPVTWKLPGSGIFMGEGSLFPTNRPVVMLVCLSCWGLLRAYPAADEVTHRSLLGEGLSSPSLKLEILSLIHLRFSGKDFTAFSESLPWIKTYGLDLSPSFIIYWFLVLFLLHLFLHNTSLCQFFRSFALFFPLLSLLLVEQFALIWLLTWNS